MKEVSAHGNNCWGEVYCKEGIFELSSKWLGERKSHSRHQEQQTKIWVWMCLAYSKEEKEMLFVLNTVTECGGRWGLRVNAGPDQVGHS